MTTEELQLGRNGCYLVADTNAHDLSTKLSGNFVVAVVVSDAVISALTDESGDDMTASGYSNFGSSTLTSGTVFSPKSLKKFGSVTLTSGSIMFYQGG